MKKQTKPKVMLKELKLSTKTHCKGNTKACYWDKDGNCTVHKQGRYIVQRYKVKGHPILIDTDFPNNIIEITFLK